MIFFKIKYLVLLLLFPLISSAQEIPDVGERAPDQAEAQQFRNKQKAEALFFEANKAKITDNPEKAITLFEECIKEDAGNDAAWYELALLYYNDSDLTKSVLHAKKAWELDPENTWYSLTLAGLYTNNSQPDEALVIYQGLYASNPGNTDYALELANIWLQLDKPLEAIEIFNKLESISGINEEYSMQKHRIYLAMGKDKKALEELEKLAKANPADSRILSLLAEFYIVQGMDEKALNTYQQIQEVDPGNPYINISLADYYRTKGDIKKATEALKTGFANPYLDANTKVQIMMTYYSQMGEYEGIESDLLELSGILTDVHPNEPRVLMLRGEMLMMTEQWQEALEIFRKANTLDPGKYQVWENILRINAIKNDSIMLATESNQAIELFPVQPMPYYFNGYANYMLKNYDIAIKSLTTGVKFVMDNNALLADFYSLTGDVFHAAKKNTESYSAYESALKYNSENAAVLNNYAYYLSLANENLDKALQMAEKANLLSPDNATYLDTWAWVLYKQGKYDKALVLMEKVLQLDKNPSADVLEHYGDILYRLNRMEEAKAWWAKALEAGRGSEFLESKVKNGKFYE
ncbi:MAG: tetratricopeptide repeat protein [Lentimicrobium sp.]|nr:tetratricopeptide repeat protein [Lentimicrobium sp.]